MRSSIGKIQAVKTPRQPRAETKKLPGKKAGTSTRGKAARSVPSTTGSSSIAAETPRKPAPANLEILYRRVFEAASDGILLVDAATGVVLDVNPALIALLGYARSAFVGRPLWELGIERNIVSSRGDFEKLRTNRHSSQANLPLRTKAGNIAFVEFVSMTYEANGRQIIQCNLHDITALQRVNEQVAYQAQLLSHVNDAIVGSDGQFRITYWNAGAESMYGWKAEEVLGRNGVEILQTQWPQADAEEMRREISRAGVWRGEASWVTKAGVQFPVEISSIVLRAASGVVTGFVTVNRDISGRVQAQSASASLAKFPSENPSPVLRISAHGTVLYANAASSELLRLWGCTTGGLAPPVWRDLVAQTLVSNMPTTVDADCNGVVLAMFLVPVIEGGYVNFYGSDITERKRAEKQVIQLTRLYATLSQVSQAIIRIKDRNALYQSICDIAVKSGEFTLAWVGLLDESSGDIRPAAAAGLEIAQWPFPIVNIKRGDLQHGLVATAIISMSLKTSEDIQTDERTRSSSSQFAEYGYHSTAAIPLCMRGKILGVLCVVSNEPGFFKAGEETRLLDDMGADISFALDTLETEGERQRLEETNRHNAQIVESSDDGILSKSLDGTILSWNKGAEALYGYSAEEAIGRPISLLVPPEQPNDAIEILARIVRGEHVEHYETVRMRRDGTRLQVSLSVSPIHSARGELLGAASIARDITERKQVQAKIQQLNAELERRVQERTAQLKAANQELEAFAYSISHDLRAPLRAIAGYTNVLLEDYEPALDAEGRRVCAVISSEARRMGQLIDDLLSFSRLSRTTMQGTELDMGAMARSVFDELTRPEERSRIAFQVGDLAPSQGDPTLMRQVWVNLLSNALKFTSRKPQAVIEVAGTRGPLETTYSVRDNGAGFDMQYVSKLFGVFQRLHSEQDFEGNGVGLAIVQRVIARHGGRVWAEGQEGQGAVFSFALPGKEAIHD